MGRRALAGLILAASAIACGTKPRVVAPTSSGGLPAASEPPDTLPEGYRLTVDGGMRGHVVGLDVTPDGKTVALVTDVDGVRVCDVASGRCGAPTAGESLLHQRVSIDATGSTVAVTAKTGLRFLDPKTGATVRSIEVPLLTPTHDEHQPSPDRTRVAVTTKTGVTVVDAKSAADVATIRLKGSVEHVEWSPDSSVLIVATDDHAVRVIDPATGKTKTGVSATGSVWCAALLDHGALLLVADARHVKVWDQLDHRALWDLDMSTRFGGAVSPDGRTFVTVANDFRRGQAFHPLELFDVRTGKPLGRIETGAARVEEPRFSADGQSISFVSGAIGAAYDELTLRTIDLATHAIHDAPMPVRRVLDAGPRTIVFGDGGASVLDGTSAAPLFAVHPPRPQELRVDAVAWGPRGRTIAAHSPTRWLRLFDAQTGALVRSVAPDSVGDSRDTHLAFTADEGALAVSDSYGLAVVEPSGSRRFTKDYREVIDLAFSPDGAVLAAATTRTLVILDARDGTVIAEPGGSGELRSIAFSPSGDALVAIDALGAVWTYDPRGGGAARREPAPRPMHALRFLADGTRVLEPQLDGPTDGWDEIRTGADGTLTLRPPFNSDLQVAAHADAIALFDGAAGAVHLFDRKQARVFAAGFGTRRVALSPDGAFFACGGDDLRLMRVADAEGLHVRLEPNGAGFLPYVVSDAGAYDLPDELRAEARVEAVAERDGPPPEPSVFLRSGLFARFRSGRSMPRMPPPEVSP